MRARLRLWVDRLIGLSAAIGAIGLIAEVLVILTDVVGRYFGAPLTGAQDISQMGMVLIVFGGMALCDRVGGHVSVDVFEPAFPRWLVCWGNAVAAFLGAAIFLGIAWAVFESAALSRMLNLSTNIINLPKAHFQYAVCALSVVTAAAMILRGVETIRGIYQPLDRVEDAI